jgi:hypothetical protein
MLRADEIRRQVAAAKARGCGRGRRAYPAALHEAVLQYAEKRREQKAGVRRIAREVGIAGITLGRWIGNPGRSRRAIVPTFRRVEVVATAPAPPGFVLRGAHGVHVVGLGLAELAELLTRLS